MDAGERLWTALDNYAPFACEEGKEPVFSLELVPGFEIEDRKELYVSTPEDFEQRIDIYTIADGYLFEMAPFGNVPVCGWLKVNDDFSEGRLRVGKDKRFCVNNALICAHHQYKPYCRSTRLCWFGLYQQSFRTGTLQTLLGWLVG